MSLVAPRIIRSPPVPQREIPSYPHLAPFLDAGRTMHVDILFDEWWQVWIIPPSNQDGILGFPREEDVRTLQGLQVSVDAEPALQRRLLQHGLEAIKGDIFDLPREGVLDLSLVCPAAPGKTVYRGNLVDLAGVPEMDGILIGVEANQLIQGA